MTVKTGQDSAIQKIDNLRELIYKIHNKIQDSSVAQQQIVQQQNRNCKKIKSQVIRGRGVYYTDSLHLLFGNNSVVDVFLSNYLQVKLVSLHPNYIPTKFSSFSQTKHSVHSAKRKPAYDVGLALDKNIFLVTSCPSELSRSQRWQWQRNRT